MNFRSPKHDAKFRIISEQAKTGGRLAEHRTSTPMSTPTRREKPLRDGSPLLALEDPPTCSLTLLGVTRGMWDLGLER